MDIVQIRRTVPGYIGSVTFFKVIVKWFSTGGDFAL